MKVKKAEGSFNTKFLLSVVALTIAGCLTFFFKEPLKILIRSMLEAEFTGYALLMFIWASFISHAVFCRHAVPRNMPYFRSGIVVLDVVSNAITYSTLGFTSLTLLKGVYIQKFFGDITYFTEFRSLDLNAILAVCAILIGYVLLNMTMLFKEAMFITTTAKEVEVATADKTGSNYECAAD